MVKQLEIAGQQFHRHSVSSLQWLFLIRNIFSEFTKAVLEFQLHVARFYCCNSKACFFLCFKWVVHVIMKKRYPLIFFHWNGEINDSLFGIYVISCFVWFFFFGWGGCRLLIKYQTWCIWYENENEALNAADFMLHLRKHLMLLKRLWNDAWLGGYLQWLSQGSGAFVAEGQWLSVWPWATCLGAWN